MDIVIPSMIDPGMAPPGKHVMSIFVQYAPSNITGGWNAEKREAFGDAVINTLSEYAPNFKSSILHRQVLTPADIEAITGLTEGNIFQGELALHQLFFLRPAPGWAKFRAPLKGLYQCGSATHPGGGIMGARRAARRARDPQGRAAMRYDVLVVGGGVNGLTTAAYLARAGKRWSCRASRDVGGTVCDRGVPSGFPREHLRRRCRLGAAECGEGARPRDAGMRRRLHHHSMTIPIDGAAPLAITPDVRATADAIRPHSARDAAKWPEFCAFVARLSGFMEALYGVRAPAVESNAPADLMTLLSLGRKLRGLGRRGMIDLIRTIPMPIADLLDEWFEHEALKGALSTLGVLNVQHGPQSGGTALVFLHNHVGLPVGRIGGRRVVRGGVGALVEALASAVTRAGGEIRTSAEVSQVRVRDDRVVGVALASGEEIEVPVVVSSADPRRTFTTLLDAGDFDPEFLHAVDCVRMRGPQVRMHLAVGALPGVWLGRRRDRFAPSMSYVERAYDAAKHGRIAEQPWLRVSIPTLDDASLAPAGKHVVSGAGAVRGVSVAGRWSNENRAALGEVIVNLIAEHAPWAARGDSSFRGAGSAGHRGAVRRD